MNKQQLAVWLLPLSLLVGCATSDDNTFDASLYDGKPIDTLSLEEPPKTEKEAITRGDIALSQGNVDLALYEYIRSLSFENGQYQDRSLYNIGRIHQSRSNLALAERAYTLSVDRNPNNIQSLEQLGILYSRSGDPKQGESYFLKAINADQLRFGSKKPLSDQDLLTVEAIAALKTDVSSPDYAYMGMGVLADLEAKHEQAQAYYQHALRIKPDSVKTLTNSGYSYYMSGDYLQAQRLSLQALDQDPNDEKALNNLALIYLGKGEINRALNVFTRHMEKPEALNNVGYFLILQGKPDKAIPYLQQAIDSKPTYYKVANENLERALALVREEESQSEK